MVAVVLVGAVAGGGGWWYWHRDNAPTENVAGGAPLEQPGALPTPATPMEQPQSAPPLSAPAPTGGVEHAVPAAQSQRSASPQPKDPPLPSTYPTPAQSRPQSPTPAAPAQPAQEPDPVPLPQPRTEPAAPSSQPAQSASPQLSHRPPTATPRSEAPAPPAMRAPSGPTSGVMTWSGKLQKNGTLTIDGASASFGTLHGSLPGSPVLVEIEPKDIGVAEAPGPGNGWRRLVLRSRGDRNIVVTIKWRTIGQ